MLLLIKIAWKNVWRSPVRSTIVIISVFLGIWAGVFSVAFMNGLNDQRLADQLNNVIADVVIVNPKFEEEKLSKFYLKNPEEISSTFQKDKRVKALTSHIKIVGMASSSAGSFGVNITGITPKEEKKIFKIYEKVIVGSYFESDKSSPIVLGEKLAKRLKLKENSKVVLTFQSVEGEIVAGAFKVVGIYKSNNTAYDEGNVFVKKEDLAKLLGSDENIVHEIVVRTENYKISSEISKKYKNQFPEASVKNWAEVSPDLAYVDDIMRQFFFIFLGIILLALSLGILNTMLMAVLERTKELGMLMAVGMSKVRIFLMIMIETVFLTFTGVPVGIILSYLTIYLSNTYGLNLNQYATGMESMGYDSIVYPTLSTTEYTEVLLMVIIAAFLSAIYPAWKALKLKPVEAIRKI